MVHLLPVERMYQNAQISQSIISQEETTYSIYGFKSAELDNYTDSIMVSTAICPVDAPIIEKVVYNYHVSYFQGYLEQENLKRYLNGEEGYGYSFYSHYWNGYLVFLKPLLLLFEYNDILMLNGIAQMLLIVWIVVGMMKNKKEILVLPFITVVMSVVPSATSLSIQYADVFYIALIGTGIIVWRYKAIDDWRGYILFLILGMMTSYFDFLTYPLVSLGIPLIVYIASKDVVKPLECIFRVIINSIGWAVGYVGMWLSKGILGSLLYPNSLALETGIGHLFWRSSETSSVGIINFMDILMKNMFAYLNWPIMILFVSVTMVYVVNIFKRKVPLKYFMQLLPYLVIALYPFAWFMVMKNHSFEHAFMVYRNLAIAVFAGLCGLANMAQYGHCQLEAD